MNSDQLPEPYQWQPDPSFDYQARPLAPKSQEDTEALNHPQPTPVEREVLSQNHSDKGAIESNPIIDSPIDK